MALVPGDRLGPYLVESPLGEGGMGEVYRASDSRLGRAVALKIISPQLVGDDASRRRFETEARAASALNHPAIITIYDVGETNGISWMAMELVEGRTLRDVIGEGPLPVREAWSIARQLADGLAAAHAKGIVHRDLKPANVMVTGDGRVKILDFGLARHNLAPLLNTASTITAAGSGAGTAAGTILGTVGYMSPEQAAGQSADARSDQFSFGAVIYELLSGRRAFDRPTAVETLSAIIRDEPLPLASMRPDVSAGFQLVIARCLEKSAAQRYESTRELAAALETVSAEAAAAEAPAPVTAQAHAAAEAHRPRPWKLAVVVAAIVAGAGVAFTPLLRNREEIAAPAAIRSVAVLPFVNTADDPEIEYLADGVTDSLIDHLSRAESLKVMARATVLRFRDEPDPRQAARALGVGAIVSGAVSRRGNQIVIAAELVDGATGERLWGQTFDRPTADLMRVQDSIVTSIADALRLRLSGAEKARLGGFATNDPEAYELFLKGRFLLQEDTEEGDLEALKMFEQAAAKDPRFFDAHLAIASVWARRSGNYESPREASVQAEAALAKARAIDPDNIALRVASAHQRFAATRDWAAAERDYRAFMNSRDIFRTIQYHPIALFFIARGRPDEAVAVTERALVEDPGNLESRVMLGNFLIQAGRLDEALRVYDAIAKEVPADARPLFGAAEVYKRRGDYTRAGDARRRAYELLEREPEARAFARTPNEAEYAKAEVAVARMELRSLEEEAKRRYVPPLDIARLHAQIGNREQALAGLERALDEPYVGLLLLKADQSWDSVRADPRFAAIVKKMGIP